MSKGTEKQAGGTLRRRSIAAWLKSLSDENLHAMKMIVDRAVATRQGREKRPAA